MKSPGPRRANGAFTLLEPLLVVIAIIAIDRIW
jgi:type II secretory pathway pseudopilin PulG